MYKKFYREDYESLNDVGNQVDKEIYDALEPIIKKWIGANYSTIELESLIGGTVSYIILSNRLSRACNLSKLRRKKKTIGEV
jgi:hypothetical protein